MMRRILLILLALITALASLSISHASEAVTLTAAGDAIPGDLLSAYVRQHPDITIAESDVYDSAALIQDAMSHSDSVDIYFMYTLISATYESLRDRGYFLELSDPEILEMASAIYPELREAATHDGALCALPFDIQLQPTLAVDMDCWAALGFDADALPTTWAEALRFAVEHWPEISEAHEEIGLFSMNDAYSFLRSIENNYEAWRTRQDGQIGYDTPEFREILALFEQLRAMDAIATGGEEDGRDYYLFDNYHVPGILPADTATRGLRMAFQPGGDPCCTAGLFVMAVNPNSKHASEAMDILKYIFANIDPVAMLVLCPGKNDPIVNENYAAQQRTFEEALKAFDARIAAASDDAERRAIELERDDYEWQASMGLEPEYIASADSIQMYREEVAGAIVPIYETGLSAEEYNAVNEKREAFLSGHLSADQYIQELERRFVFSALERQ